MEWSKNLDLAKKVTTKKKVIFGKFQNLEKGERFYEK